MYSSHFYVISYHEWNSPLASMTFGLPNHTFSFRLCVRLQEFLMSGRLLNLVLEFVQGRALQMLRLLSSKMLSSVERSILFLHMRLRRRVGLESPPPVAAAGSRGHLGSVPPLRARAPPGMSVRAPRVSGTVAPTARVPASPFPLLVSEAEARDKPQPQPNLLRPNQSPPLPARRPLERAAVRCDDASG